MTEASVQEQAPAAEEFLSGLVAAFGLNGTVTSEEVDEAVEVRIDGDDLGLLIGRRGDTLIALQYLVNLILGRKYPGRGGVTIDVEHYKHRNEERIVSMANRMAERVRESGNPITLEPLSASERRLIHMMFADDPELETNSTGEGEHRKVVISLRQ